jgi:dihydropteroate synthase
MLTTTLENNYFRKKSTIRYNGELIELSSPSVMGILNITPDSFFDGGLFNSLEKAMKQTEKMVSEGASIIDIGACSTRPGAAEVSVIEEINRLLPMVKEVRAAFPSVVISIDTYRAEVAERIVDTVGDCIINDISGGTLDPAMFETIARLKVPYILMHIQGTPKTMQQNPTYENVTKEVIGQLSKGVFRLHELGVSDVIIDPGFGFGKTLSHNYELFNNLDAFRMFELPLLVGISRKSMIFRLLEQTPEESLEGTTVLNTLAIIAGADILRVHDVKPAVDAIKIIEQLKTFSK